MKRVFLGLCILGLLMTAPVSAAPSRPPIGADLFWREQNDGANRPWLDPTCYDDDHVAYGMTTGWMDAGETFTVQSKRLICHVKIQRGLLSFHQRLDADLSLIDYGGHSIPDDRQVFDWRKSISYGACNTDIGVVIPGVNLPPGQLHVDLDPTGSEPGESAGFAYWTIHAHRSGEYTLQMILNEPWWSGGESSMDYCLP